MAVKKTDKPKADLYDIEALRGKCKSALGVEQAVFDAVFCNRTGKISVEDATAEINRFLAKKVRG